MLLARLFLQKPRVVLIDEGTSALDSQTESDIKRSIARQFPKSTLIIVAYVYFTLTPAWNDSVTVA
jgi:ABC-type bacteriocin/lantibiotic exporter with double-glycine peptidase domain